MEEPILLGGDFNARVLHRKTDHRNGGGNQARSCPAPNMWNVAKINVETTVEVLGTGGAAFEGIFWDDDMHHNHRLLIN